MEDDDGCMDDQSESFVNDCSFDPSPETTQYDSSTDQLINKPYYNSTYNPSPMYPYKASNSLWGVNTTTSPPSSLCNTSVLEDRLMMSEDSGTFELDTEVVFHRPFQATTSTTPSTTAPLNYKGALIRNMCKDWVVIFWDIVLYYSFRKVTFILPRLVLKLSYHGSYFVFTIVLHSTDRIYCQFVSLNHGIYNEQCSNKCSLNIFFNRISWRCNDP